MIVIFFCMHKFISGWGFAPLPPDPILKHVVILSSLKIDFSGNIMRAPKIVCKGGVFYSYTIRQKAAQFVLSRVTGEGSD